ncbi:hypothetical protein D3C85_1060130 [compost metagenome]
MGRTPGRHFVVRLGFDRVYEVRELDGVLNEKHRHVVAHQVVVAFIGEELHREPSDVPHGIARPTWTLHRGKAHEHRGFLRRVL